MFNNYYESILKIRKRQIKVVLVFFIYGLAFFTMGVVIFLYPKRESKFKLANSLWLIGVFGILHGLNEWIDLFIFLQQPMETMFLKFIRLFLLPASFIFLVFFGVKIIVETKKKYTVMKFLPHILFLSWLIILICIVVSEPAQVLLMGDIWARYLIAFPGAVLTFFALILQLSLFKETKMSAVIVNLKLAAGAFLLYSIFAGIIVPKADFFPACFLNYTSFFGWVAIPVQVFRSLLAVIISYSIGRVLGIFDWETKTKIRNLLRKAYESEKQRKNLSNMIVHDINNLLTLIISCVGAIFSDSKLPQSISDEVKEIEKAVVDLRNMTSTILYIEKLESGEMMVLKEKVDFCSLIEQRLNKFRNWANDSGVNLIIKLPKEECVLNTDMDLLSRVFDNLISNALKFVYKGGSLVIEASVNDNNKVIFTVTNDGDPIPSEYHKLIFEKFSQLEVRQSLGRKGVGLGLTFCKMAVEAMGGTISVESPVPGKADGVRFVVNL